MCNSNKLLFVLHPLDQVHQLTLSHTHGDKCVDLRHDNLSQLELYQRPGKNMIWYPHLQYGH